MGRNGIERCRDDEKTKPCPDLMPPNSLGWVTFSFSWLGYVFTHPPSKKKNRKELPGPVIQAVTFLGWWVKTWPFQGVVGDLQGDEVRPGIERSSLKPRKVPHNVKKSMAGQRWQKPNELVGIKSGHGFFESPWRGGFQDQEMPGSTGPPARSFKETQEKDEGSVLGGIRGEGRLSFSESMLIHWCFLQWWYPTPHFTPQVPIIFSRKTHGCWGNHPF